MKLPKLPSTTAIVAFLGTTSAFVITALMTFNVVHLSTDQFQQVSLTDAAAVAFVGATIGHFRKGTSPEPLALAVSATALAVAICGTGNLFDWFSLSAAQIGIITSAVAFLFGGGTGALARDKVTPTVPHNPAPKQ